MTMPSPTVRNRGAILPSMLLVALSLLLVAVVAAHGNTPSPGGCNSRSASSLQWHAKPVASSGDVLVPCCHRD